MWLYCLWIRLQVQIFKRCPSRIAFLLPERLKFCNEVDWRCERFFLESAIFGGQKTGDSSEYLFGLARLLRLGPTGTIVIGSPWCWLLKSLSRAGSAGVMIVVESCCCLLVLFGLLVGEVGGVVVVWPACVLEVHAIHLMDKTTLVSSSWLPLLVLLSPSNLRRQSGACSVILASVRWSVGVLGGILRIGGVGYIFLSLI